MTTCAASQVVMMTETIVEDVDVLSDLPLFRDDGKVTSSGQLKAIISVLGIYLDSLNTKSPPSKDELSVTVQSLLSQGEKLDRKWNKE